MWNNRLPRIIAFPRIITPFCNFPLYCFFSISRVVSVQPAACMCPRVGGGVLFVLSIYAKSALAAILLIMLFSCLSPILATHWIWLLLLLYCRLNVLLFKTSSSFLSESETSTGRLLALSFDSYVILNTTNNNIQRTSGSIKIWYRKEINNLWVHSQTERQKNTGDFFQIKYCCTRILMKKRLINGC